MSKRPPQPTTSESSAKIPKLEDGVDLVHKDKELTQEHVLANFYYFGATFCHLQTQVTAEICSSLSFKTFKTLRNASKMTEAITRDMALLTNAKLGRNDEYKANGVFSRLEKLDEIVFVYEHCTYAKCSSVYYRCLKLCFNIDVRKEYMPPCSEKLHHICLEPFFCDNESVLRAYESAQSESLKEDIKLLKKIVERKANSTGTQFQCPLGETCNWNKDDWTLRLSHGIQKLLPDRTVTFTAQTGLNWESQILPLLHKVSISGSYYLFRGAPDILIQKRRVVFVGMAGSQESTGNGTSSSEEEIIESTFQRPPMKGLIVPEKLGEVFAGLHLLLVSKILRRISKGKCIFNEKLMVKGVLIDKIIGAYHCLLSVEMSNGKTSRLNLQVVNYSGINLMPQNLCAHINAIVSKPSAN